MHPLTSKQLDRLPQLLMEAYPRHNAMCWNAKSQSEVNILITSTIRRLNGSFRMISIVISSNKADITTNMTEEEAYQVYIKISMLLATMFGIATPFACDIYISNR